MNASYVVLETDAGLTVEKVEAGQSAEACAEQHGGVVVDPTLYRTYDDAYDALLLIQAEDDDGLDA